MSAFDQINQLLAERKSFVLEAGAGSGKTFTLVQTINHVLSACGKDLVFRHQQIACITYTNVAKNEIIDRLENNPAVAVLTIHEFLWANLHNFQHQLLLELDILNAKMAEAKPDNFQPGLLSRGNVKEVTYEDSGFRDFENGQLHHDDVISLAGQMIRNYAVLRNIIVSKYPYIFIDEYQDTAVETATALINDLLGNSKGKLILGFYGDSYQKIYETGVGALDAYVGEGKLHLVTKPENYRSSAAVIGLLNKIRTNIIQVAPDDKTLSLGSVTFINCDNYPVQGSMRVREYEQSIVPLKNQNYDAVIRQLEKKGWDFGDKSDDKILIIANSRVAERAGFGELYRVTATRYGERANDALLKRDNQFVRFFVGTIDKKTSKERKSGVEHLCSAWADKDYHFVISFLNSYGPARRSGPDSSNDSLLLKRHFDKVLIAEKIDELAALRAKATVKEVFDFAMENRVVKVHESLRNYLDKLQRRPEELPDDKDRERQQRDIDFFNAVMTLPYRQFINLFEHTQNHTVFSTKHGTKGEEYRNVLVVIDDTNWKQKYNFEDYISNAEQNAMRKLMTKNLFYVSCSRAVENLVILALSKFETPAMNIIKGWFPSGRVYTISQTEDI